MNNPKKNILLSPWNFLHVFTATKISSFFTGFPLKKKKCIHESMYLNSTHKLVVTCSWVQIHQCQGHQTCLQNQVSGHDCILEDHKCSAQPVGWGVEGWGVIPDSSGGKESTCNVGDPGWIPGSGRSAGEGIGYPLQYCWDSLVAQLLKNLPAMRETWVRSLGWKEPLEKGKATHSSIMA